MAPAPTSEDPPPVVMNSRTVLPPLEVEVVAGDSHRVIRPGSNSVHVDLHPGEPPQPAPEMTTPGETETAASVTSNASERVQMSENASAIVTSPVKPSYPLLARQMKVQGSVILEALIGKDGIIQNLQVVRGPHILASAAEDAVRQWHFKPHLEGRRKRSRPRPRSRSTSPFPEPIDLGAIRCSARPVWRSSEVLGLKPGMRPHSSSPNDEPVPRSLCEIRAPGATLPQNLRHRRTYTFDGILEMALWCHPLARKCLPYRRTPEFVESKPGLPTRVFPAVTTLRLGACSPMETLAISIGYRSHTTVLRSQDLPRHRRWVRNRGQPSRSGPEN